MKQVGPDRILRALDSLPAKRAQLSRSEKKKYSEAMSHALAGAVAASFSDAGLPEVRPSQDSSGRTVGQERRMAGGIGAKKVDVTCASAESGLLLACSIKTINWRDRKVVHFRRTLPIVGAICSLRVSRYIGVSRTPC